MAERRRRAAEARLAWWVARRYLLARGHGYATFINWVSFVGLALGVASLTVVLSVMNGFNREIASRILSAVPHAVVVPRDGATPDVESLLTLPGVSHAHRFFQGEAMLVRGGGSAEFIALTAVDAAGARRMRALLGDDALARLLDEPGGIVLGDSLAAAAGLAVGDPVVLLTALPTGAGVRPRLIRFELAGTFAVGADPDAALAVAMHDDVVRRGLAAAGVDGWRLHFDDPITAADLVAPIRAALGDEAEAWFWTRDYGELFRAVKMEKAIMFALLALIVAIAAFNIVAGQAMLVNDKRGDVAMLATLGAPRRLVVAVFFLQGFAVAFFGVAAGLAAGVALAQNADAAMSTLEGVIGASIIDGTWFAEIPSQVQAGDLVAVAALSLGLSLLAVLRPALRATAENPADALHSA